MIGAFRSNFRAVLGLGQNEGALGEVAIAFLTRGLVYGADKLLR